MDLTEILRVLRARWGVVALCIVVGSSAAWLSASAARTAQRSSSTQFRATTSLISEGSSSSQLGGFSAGLTSLTTIAALATSTPVATDVAEQIGTDIDPAELASAVEASADVQSGVVNITATSDDRQEAKLLADSFAEALILYLQEKRAESARIQAKALQRDLDDLRDQISELNAEIERLGEESPEAEVPIHEREGQLGLVQQLSTMRTSLLLGTGDRVGVSVLEDATVIPVSTGGFQPPRSQLVRTALAALIGLLVGIGLALLFERMRARVRTREEAEESAGLPVLAEIPRIGGAHRREIAVLEEPRSAVAEAFRLLDSSLMSTIKPEGDKQGVRRANGSAWPQTILVTSAEPGGGKSTVVANLAAASAEVGRRVAVLSCDFRHPGLRPFFDGEGTIDLTHVLITGEAAELFVGSANVVATPNGEIRVIDSSPAPGRSRELLSSETMRRVLVDARRHADVVLIDTAPLVTAGDVAPLLGEADAVLLVARVGKTTVEQTRRAGELLELLKAPALGVVMNGFKGRSMSRGYFRSERRGRGEDAARKTRREVGDDGEPVEAVDGAARDKRAGEPGEHESAHAERGFSPTSTSSDR
jgi:capsular exopolysaccharide synthesis family protein